MSHARVNMQISALNEAISTIYGVAACEDREYLSEEEVERVEDLAWRLTALYATQENIRTGPYRSRDELVRLIRRSYFPRVVGSFFICRNTDGTWAWYCDECLLREGDVIDSTMEWNRATSEYDEWPIS